MFHDRITGEDFAELPPQVAADRFVARVATHAGVVSVPGGARITGVPDAPTLAPHTIDVVGTHTGAGSADARLLELAEAPGSDDPADTFPLATGVADQAAVLERERLLDASTRLLLDVCVKPTAKLRGREEIVWLSRAKRLSTRGESWIDGHPEQWAGWQRGAPMPHKAPAVLPTTELDLYENRLVARLVDRRLLPVLRSRRRTLEQLKRNHEFASTSFGHHTLNSRLGELWGEWVEHDDDFDARLRGSLEFLRDLIDRVQRLQRTPLMEAIARSATVPSQLRRTNILRGDARYRRVGELWDAFRFEPQASLEDRVNTAARLAAGHDRFVRVLVARALRELEAIAAGTCTARMNDLDEGLLELVPVDAPPLRVVPLLAATAGAALAELAPDRDATIVVHSTPEQGEELGSVARRGGMWLVGTSPLDLRAVERVGQVIRTHVLGARLAALPLEVELAPSLARLAPELGLADAVPARTRSRYVLARAPTARDLEALAAFVAASDVRGRDRDVLLRDVRDARDALEAAGDRMCRALICPRPYCRGTGAPLSAGRDRYLIACNDEECTARWGMQTCAVCGEPLAFFTLHDMPELLAASGHGVSTSELFGMTVIGELVPDGDAVAVVCACGHRQSVSTARRS